MTSTLAPEHQKFLADFPRDIKSTINSFALDSKSIIYAVCPNPRCHHLHKPSFHEDSPIPEYPRKCQACATRRRKQDLLCTRIINRREVSRPIKSYVHHDFQSWMGGLLSRPGVEDEMDSSWEETFHDKTPHSPITSIFGGRVLRTFQGPDGAHFADGGDEGRFVFSLGVDFFNPFGNKQAGKKRSIGMVSLMCLNLPPHLRYLPENVFLVGIIPGPNEPRWHLVNAYLEPLVDDFLLFWQPGVWFTRTSNYPNGRFILCAIVVVVCDCLAARKVAGYAAHSHNHFCHICYCTRKEQGYGDTNHADWKRREHADVKTEAENWKASFETSDQGPTDATPTAVAGDSPVDFKQAKADSKASPQGVRWSALLRLPYFDIVRFVVVDGMHNLFLGLVKDHFRQVLGMDEAGRLAHDEDERGGPTVEKPTCLDVSWSSTLWMTFSEAEQKDVHYLYKALRQPMNASLADPTENSAVMKRFQSRHLQSLKFVCDDLKLDAVPYMLKGRLTKYSYTKAIITWVSLCRLQL